MVLGARSAAKFEKVPSTTAFLITIFTVSYISNSKKIVDLSGSAQIGGGGIFWIFKSILMFVSAPCAKNKQGNVNAGSKGGL